MPLPVIDLFAGPGGLAEGFSSFRTPDGNKPFRVALSIERDEFAHATLLLRSFTRQFPDGALPDEYYEYLRGKTSRSQLFDLYPEQSEHAKAEAWKAELGSTSRDEVDRRLQAALQGSRDWILIGGPPCQAYSTAGRSRMRGANKEKFEQDERHFLYKEYLYILRTHSPKVFVMENVKGILSSKVGRDGIFENILFDLSAATLTTPGYSVFSFVKDGQDQLKPKDLVVQSEQYAIPQTRHRVLILGVRNDVLKRLPFLPSKRALLQPKAAPSVGDAIGDLPKLRSRLSREPDSYTSWAELFELLPVSGKLGRYAEDALFGSVLDAASKSPAPNEVGDPRFVEASRSALSGWLEENREWYIDERLGGVCNHESRGHMREDLYRYLFASCYAAAYRKSPRLHVYPKELLPKHRTANKAVSEKHGFFGDRFRVQVASAPSTTIVSHIAKDGHYYIHPDPAQCRSLTAREAARLQTFPDNYFFEGPRTEQYRQIGNAVPPLLARKLAESVFSMVEQFTELEELGLERSA